jgi:ketosteroid isomerase-like protein
VADKDLSSAALERERGLWEAFRSNDSERLVALIHPTALDVGPSGVLDRASVLSAVARMEIIGFSIEEFTLRSFETVEVVTYRSTVDGTYGGRPFTDSVVRATTVWMLHAERWVVIHRHEAPVRDDGRLFGPTNL